MLKSFKMGDVMKIYIVSLISDRPKTHSEDVEYVFDTLRAAFDYVNSKGFTKLYYGGCHDRVTFLKPIQAVGSDYYECYAIEGHHVKINQEEVGKTNER